MNLAQQIAALGMSIAARPKRPPPKSLEVICAQRSAAKARALERIYEFIANQPRRCAASREVCEQFGWSTSTCNKYLRALKDAGRLELVGRGNNVKWGVK